MHTRTVLLAAALLAPTVALAEDADEAPDSDVVATRTIEAPRQAVYAVLTDTARIAELAPERCMRKWEVAPDGDTFEVLYLMEAFRRKLQVVVEEKEPPRRLEWDHLGRKGFVTRFMLEETEAGGTQVTMTTFVAPPGWPLKKYYFNTIQPAWTTCQDQLLEAVDGAATGG